MDHAERRGADEIPGRTTLQAKIAKVREKRKHTKKPSKVSEKILGDAIRERTVQKIGEGKVEVEEDSDEDVEDEGPGLSFQDFKLCRPLMKAINEVNWTEPTLIQQRAIPTALKGQDITACATTGSGKTAAFMIPIVERLSHKSLVAQQFTRALVIVPTRELAVQVHATTRLLTKYLTKQMSLCLLAGGLDIKSQEAALRHNPDIVVATPGRLIDHIYNTPSWALDAVEVLVLDEADRILEENFEEQLDEISKQCSKERQTMMFSATMTEKVKELQRICKNPEKIFINENTDVAGNLRQQFVRVREEKIEIREAMVAALVQRNFSMHSLVFVRTKLHAHRMNILLRLLDLRSAELHGDMKQKDRLNSLREFKNGDVDVLVCTDLASRGLDIPLVENVINLSLPKDYKGYVHRVGRTARAGKSGLAVSLVSENDRTLFEKIIKMNKKNPKALKLENRTVPKETLDEYLENLAVFEDHVKDILAEEEAEKHIQVVEKDIRKAERKLTFDKSKSRGGPEHKRGWFQQHHERSMKDQDKFKFFQKNRKKLPKTKDGRHVKGSFGKDLSDTSRKNVKGMRHAAGIKRKRR